MKKKWNKRLSKVTDFSKISLFRKTFPLSIKRSCEKDYYEWKYYKNPVQMSEMCLVEDNDKIVGMTGIAPKYMKILNQRIISAELCDGFTDPNYQGQGIFSTLLRNILERSLEKGINIIYGTPNKLALPVEKKAGYEIIPYLRLKNFIKPINIKQTLELKIKNKLLISLLVPLLNLIYCNFFKMKRAKYLNNKIKIRKIVGFDIRIDNFFDNVSKNYDIILERNKKYLNWRYIENPDNYNIFLAKDNDKILGYIITKTGSFSNLKVGYIVDFLTINNKVVFYNLLFEVFREFYEKNVDLVSCWAIKNSFYAKVLLRKGFLPLKNIPVIIYKNEFGRRIIHKNFKWHFTMADSDNI